jgi:outer membrane receptor protein involved in Fe transport
VDLRISYAPVGAHWKVEVFGTNITNTHYLKDSGNTGSDIGLPTDIPGEPAFYGVSFTIRR